MKLNNKTFLIAAFVLLIGLIVFANEYSAGDGGAGSDHGGLPQSANTQTATGTADAGEAAPDFSLERLNGGTISLAEYRGVKPVILDFWASWCPNCRRDMPVLSRFYEKYKDEVEVIGINLQEPRSTVEDFISSRNISFPVALDPRSTAARDYGVYYTNTHVLIDDEGNLIRVIPGDISESDVTSLIELSKE